MKLSLSIALSLLFSSFTFAQYNVTPKTHSHNDYEQNIPLFEALDNNFNSIEVDIHRVGDELFVAHNAEEIDSNKTLNSLYLKPLFDLFVKRGNKIYNNSSLILMLDIKTAGPTTYSLLKDQLEKYKQMFTCYYLDSLSKGAIDIILSGNRPIKNILSTKNRMVAIDGRPKDVFQNESSNLYPMISEDWVEILKRYPLESQSISDTSLVEFIKLVHTQNKVIRFWGTEDNEDTWENLLNLNVDLISTDYPTELKMFLEKRKKMKKNYEEISSIIR